MNLLENQEIQSTLAALRSGMIDFMEHATYQEADVEQCILIMRDYLGNMNAVNHKEAAMQLVKSVVLKLNDLNEKCDYELIETDQREELAEIIIMAGHLKGFNGMDDDITEEWRDW